jgi:hypothetical protein
MICPKCWGFGKMTPWVPPKGTDPYLREYKCLNLGHIFYAHTGRRAKVKSTEEKNLAQVMHL